MYESHAGKIAIASLLVMMISNVMGMAIFSPKEINPYIFAAMCIFNLFFSTLMIRYWIEKYKEEYLLEE